MSEEISSLELISRPDECFNVLEIAVLYPARVEAAVPPSDFSTRKSATC